MVTVVVDVDVIVVVTVEVAEVVWVLVTLDVGDVVAVLVTVVVGVVVGLVLSHPLKVPAKNASKRSFKRDTVSEHCATDSVKTNLPGSVSQVTVDVYSRWLNSEMRALKGSASTVLRHPKTAGSPAKGLQKTSGAVIEQLAIIAKYCWICPLQMAGFPNTSWP